MTRIMTFGLPVVFAATLIITLPAQAEAGSLMPQGLRVEYSDNPLGIDAATPRLSWHSTSPERSARQTAYRVQTTAGDGDFDRGDLL